MFLLATLLRSPKLIGRFSSENDAFTYVGIGPI